MTRAQVIVFAKAPRPGFVKTRLSPPLSSEQAAELYDAMLGDVLEVTGRFAAGRGLDAVLAFDPPDAVGEMLTRAPIGFRLQLQRGLGLGERMANAFAECFAAGTPWALLRGSDSPALAESQLEEAARHLEARVDLVLTPDRGGGYALIGLRAPQRSLFELTLSGDRVLTHTLALAERAGLRCVLTEPTVDIDHVTDFAQLESMATEEASDRCPRTVEALAELRGAGVL